MVSAMNATKELNQMIDGALRANAHTARKEVLEAIQWRLRGPNGEFVGLNGVFASFVPESGAIVYNGFDNADLKLPFFQSVLKSELTVEILPQSK